MNAKYRRLEAEFGPDARFELRPVSVAPFKAVFEDQFEHLKARLLAESLESVWESQLNSDLRRAANEAAALAWLTQYPLLVFPVLFQEKSNKLVLRAARHNGMPERKCQFIAL